MRRENSKFNTSFLSCAGARLFNNDYYGSAELDRYACYVAADGLDDGGTESESAKLAVQAAIAAFHAKPGISKRALRRYAVVAHNALRANSGHLGLRASVTVVVTDYQKVRYAWAGNTRFYLYRAGRLLHESRDHSLSRNLADKGALEPDKIARHEERNNLSAYAGKPGRLRPSVSKKLKLQDGDIFALVTRGVWEQLDSGDVKAAIDSGENDPQAALECLERLLLDRHPDDVDNYTAAVVFADKIYVDPKKGKRLKVALAIAIPVFAILLALAIVMFVLHKKNEAKRQDMQAAYLNAVEYVGDNNYVRAGDEIGKSVKLADELRDAEFQDKAGKYQKLTEAVLNADELFAKGSYEEAEAAYMAARDRSRYTDLAGSAYIERKLAAVGSCISVRDLVALGDALAALGSYGSAEQKYLEARRLATGAGDKDGRQLALDALDSLYETQKQSEQSAAEAAEQQARTLKEAADMESAGDSASAEKDFLTAKLDYSIARERFTAIGDMDSVTRIDGKLSALADAQSKNAEQSETARGYVEDGDALFDDENYVDAKVKYIQARNIFSRVQDEVAVADVISKIEMCDVKLGAIVPPLPTPTSPEPSETLADPTPEPSAAIDADTPAESAPIR